MWALSATQFSRNVAWWLKSRLCMISMNNGVVTLITECSPVLQLPAPSVSFGELVGPSILHPSLSGLIFDIKPYRFPRNVLIFYWEIISSSAWGDLIRVCARLFTFGKDFVLVLCVNLVCLSILKSFSGFLVRTCYGVIVSSYVNDLWFWW